MSYSHSKLSAQSQKRALFFCRKSCDATSKALDHLQRIGFEVTTIYSKARRESLPQEAMLWTGDYIFCFRSLYILPKTILNAAQVAAINFHPGPAEYPGSGCINYALYDDSDFFGVTAHLMNEKVDDGRILECRRFPVHAHDNVSSLLDRTHVKLLDLFFDVTSAIALSGSAYIGESLERSQHEKWSGRKRSIKELDALSIVDKNVSEADLDRIVRATFTPSFPPKIMLHGYEFILKSDKDSTST